jgi:hypothetical protein
MVLVLLTDCQPRLDSENWKERRDAVKQLSDQAQLVEVALKEKDRWIGSAAVEKLTDQALLGRVALEAWNPQVRGAAVEKLTDQALLARVACAHYADNIYDYVGRPAIVKLADQAVLGKIALVGGHDAAGKDAAEKVTDQALLAKVALVWWHDAAGETARAKLTDRGLGSRLASSVGRANEISKLADSDPVLMQLAGDMGIPTWDARECIARMKLAVREPSIALRFPHLHCVATVSKTTSPELYVHRGDPNRVDLGVPGIGAYHVSGEYVSIALRQSGKTLAEGSWSTVFRSQMNPDSDLGADVSAEDLLKTLLHLSAFTPQDLAELVQSNIVEVRLGAAANVTDQALLARVAIEDKSPGDWQPGGVLGAGRPGGVFRDPVATELKEAGVRGVAVGRLTDQAVLTRVASKDQHPAVRRAAVQRLADLRNSSRRPSH